MSATVMPGIFYFQGMAVEANESNLNIVKTRKEAEKTKGTGNLRMQGNWLKSRDGGSHQAKTGESGKLSDR